MSESMTPRLMGVSEKDMVEILKKQLNGGTKDDGEKPKLSLIPPLAILEEARVWTFGAKKYAAYNWCKGIVYSRILSATFRHLLSIIGGEDIDPETGLLHAAHIRCNMGMLIHYIQIGSFEEFDDRYKEGET